MQELSDLMKERAKTLLSEGKVQKVVGWKKGLFDDDVTPAVFENADELESGFVFNKFCAANLSKYLIEITKSIETRKSTFGETERLRWKKRRTADNIKIRSFACISTRKRD